MIKKFSQLEVGDHFLFIDKNGDRRCLEMFGRINDSSIRVIPSNTPYPEYLVVRIWTVNNNPDKLIPVFARSK